MIEKALGHVLSKAKLTELAKVTIDDVERAARAWRADAPDRVKSLLDARPPKPSERRASDT